MNSIEWGGFEGSVFQRFCNSVIMLEVSKLAHVFSAAGKDQGIDQYYTGAYEGKDGKWRFQDKFHHSGTKTNDIAAFKRDIKKDIEKNYDSENYIIYLTNINLGTAKLTELVNHAKAALAEKGITSCEVFIWHEAKLETVVALNPVLYNWYFEKENILLQDYQVYFKKQLSDGSDLRYQLKNPFFGRTEDLAKLEEFTANPTISTLGIVANGGYGKTRLCIEFFSEFLADKKEWLPVVLSHTGFTPSSLSVLLRTPTRLIILIDNANEIPHIVNDVKQLVDNSEGRHKLILTARKALFSSITARIPAYRNDIQVHPLDRLKYPETKAMVSRLLPFLKEKEVVYIANLSKGVPNMILELARIIKNGKQPYEISTENVFAESVRSILTEVASDINRTTSLPPDKIFDFLRLVSVISPVVNSQENLEFIASLLKLRPDQLELLIHELEKAEILDNSSVISIKPDPYSDSLLAETIQQNKQFIEHIRTRPGMERYFENILKNLAEAELSKKDVSHFIEDLLSGYIALIEKNETPGNKVKAIFEFTESIFFSHPHLAVKALESFVKIFENKDHPFHNDFATWSNTSIAGEIKEITDRIITKIFSQSAYAKDKLDTLHEILLKYIKVTNNFKIINLCYGYHEWEFRHSSYHPRKCCERQEYFKKRITSDLTSCNDPFILQVALDGAMTLLKLEYQLEQYFEQATMKYSFGTGFVITCEHTKEIRNKAIEALMIFYERPGIGHMLKEQAFSEFIHYLFYASVNYDKRFRYEIDEETTKILIYLRDLLIDGKLGPEQKERILEKSRLFQMAGIRAPFTDLIDEILDKAARTASLYEDLEMCLINQNYFDVRINLEKRMIDIVDGYKDFNFFRADLIALYKIYQTKTQTFPAILTIINQKYTGKAAPFFQEILDNHAELAGAFSALVTANYKDSDYFYGIIKTLWKVREKYERVVLWLLTAGRNGDRSVYMPSDLEYFDAALEGGSPALGKMPLHTIPQYSYIDKARTFDILDRIMTLAAGEFYNMMIYTLFDEGNKYGEDFPHDIKELLFKHVGKFIIDEPYYGDLVLAFLEKQFGFNTLLEFVHLKVKNSVTGNSYKWINLTEHTYKNNKSDESANNKRYLHFLSWFMKKEQSEEELIIEEYMLTMFRPDVEFSASLSETVLQIACENAGHQSKIQRLATAIRLFPPVTEELIITMARIAELTVNPSSNERTIHDVFGNNFYYNMGSKSKSGIGVPYTEDVQKRDLFQKVLSEHSFLPAVTSYLETCKERVQKDIEVEIKSDKEKVEW